MIENQTFTSIGKSTILSGKFNFEGPTHLLGKISGEIEGLGQITLEIGSVTEGTLHCTNLEIYGEFTGEIKASGAVILYPTAVVNGKIIAKSLEILPGAVVNINGHTD